MANIYDFMAGFAALWALIEDEAVEDAVIEDCFANMTDDLKLKMENCCKYIKNLDAEINGLKDEEARLKAKRKAKENAKDRIKKLMLAAQLACGEKKLECGTFTTTVQKNPPKFVPDYESVYDVPEEFLKYAEPEVKTKEALDAMKAGATFTWGHSVQEDSLRIR